jgi:hypothetical protein
MKPPVLVVIIGVLAALGPSSTLRCQAPSASAINMVICSAGGDRCGLGEPETAERYRALSDAFIKDKKSVAISYDLLLAVLDSTTLPGETQEGPRFSLDSMHGLRGRYSFGRTYPLGLTEGSASVTINVPGLGVKTYDADVIRLLLPTEVFPNKLKLRYVNSGSGGSAAYARLNAEPANIVLESFAAGTEDAIKKVAAQASSKYPRLSAALLRLPLGREFIQLVPDPYPTPFERFNPEQKKNEYPHRDDWTGCDVRLALTIPRRPVARYKQIDVRATIKKPGTAIAYLCGPPNLEPNGKPNTDNRCVNQEVIWSLSGEVLNQSTTQTPLFRFFVEYPKSEQSNNLWLEFSLKGELKSQDAAAPPQPITFIGECK